MRLNVNTERCFSRRKLSKMESIDGNKPFREYIYIVYVRMNVTATISGFYNTSDILIFGLIRISTDVIQVFSCVKDRGVEGVRAKEMLQGFRPV